MAMSTVLMVEDGVIKIGGAELGLRLIFIYLIARDHEL